MIASLVSARPRGLSRPVTRRPDSSGVPSRRLSPARRRSARPSLPRPPRCSIRPLSSPASLGPCRCSPSPRSPGVAAPLPLINVDTDKIIPARYLKTIKRTGLGVHLLETLRYDEQGKERPDFVLNREPYRHAHILIAGENFGCGSSASTRPGPSSTSASAA